MEQLIIFLLFVVGSIISSIIQHKKKQAEEQQQRELEQSTRREPGQQPRPVKPQAKWPQTAADWQEQLRRMLEGESTQSPTPPVIKPVLLPPVAGREQKPAPKPTQRGRQTQPPLKQEVILPREKAEGDIEFASPLKTSSAHYERAARLHESVEQRLRAVAEQTSTHKPATPMQSRYRPHSQFVQRLRHNPRAIREAFIASIIFGPPKSMERIQQEPFQV